MYGIVSSSLSSLPYVGARSTALYQYAEIKGVCDLDERLLKAAKEQYSVPIAVLGPIDTKRENQEWARKLVARFCYPSVKEWPTLEAYWDVFWYPIICEFTVHQPMARNAYVWGYLAARQ